MSEGPPALGAETKGSYETGNRNLGINGSGGEDFPGPSTWLLEQIRK